MAATPMLTATLTKSFRTDSPFFVDTYKTENKSEQTYIISVNDFVHLYRDPYFHLSHDIMSWRDIKPCIIIDKSLAVEIFSNIML